MFRSIAIAVVVLLSATAALANVINIEFKFTPFVGDPAKQDQVETVPGVARVFINNVPFAEQEVSRSEVPVLFEEREIAASVWLPAESCGPALRKGKNTLRIEFEPEDAKASYRAHLRWASVMDETVENSEPGHYSATNQAAEGVDDKEAKGKVVFEREFTADFASDLPWHHYSSVATLNDEERKFIAALVAQRVEAFSPDFSKLYALLDGNAKVDAAALRSAKCIEAAYDAGVRITSAAADKIEIVTTGQPEVVVRASDRPLFYPVDPSAFEKIEGDEAQMAVSMALFALYPPRLVVVRAPSGAWEVAY